MNDDEMLGDDFRKTGCCKSKILPYWRSYVLIITPLALLPLLIVVGTKEARCGYGILLMAVYWMTEALPLPVTSLLPVVLFPLFGIMSTEEACRQYLKETNMMFIGGLIVAIAVEHCCLHKRIALKVLLFIGCGPKRLMAGFMFVTMFLSMWISNTATTAMMMPIVEAVLDELFRNEMPERDEITEVKCMNTLVITESKQNLGIPKVKTCETTLYDSKEDLDAMDNSNIEWKPSSNGGSGPSTPTGEEMRKAYKAEKKLYRVIVMLSVAYSANIGGTGTMTGSGPNLVLKGMLTNIYGPNTGLNFATWMLFGIPTMLLCVVGAYGWLLFLYRFKRPKIHSDEDNSKFVRHIVKVKYDDLGPITFHEICVLVLFIAVVLLWFFRDPQFIPGWASLFPLAEVDDGTAAIFVCIFLFAVPASINFWCFRRGDARNLADKPGPSLLDWNVVQKKMPWGVVILLGGGFSMAEASKVSGLSAWLGQQLVPLHVLPPAAIVVVVCIMTAAVTEVTSNVATATVLLPVLSNLAKSLEVHPLYLMFPATITCSYAYMLPIATPPNAIAFSTGKMKSKDMLFPGLFMNILCVAVITLTINTLGVAIFDLNTFPDWARPINASLAVTHRS
ncbi:hypothetical protein CHUAL_005850 [Chamberlinius hualienensis]